MWGSNVFLHIGDELVKKGMERNDAKLGGMCQFDPIAFGL